MNRRAVVLGSAGQLGVELVRELRARGYAAMGWDRDEVDITDAAAVENAIAGFDGVISIILKQFGATHPHESRIINY